LKRPQNGLALVLHRPVELAVVIVIYRFGVESDRMVGQTISLKRLTPALAP